jgi:hypothetical protein
MQDPLTMRYFRIIYERVEYYTTSLSCNYPYKYVVQLDN